LDQRKESAVEESELARRLRAATEGVHSGEPSTINWTPASELVAEALGAEDGIVYASTVSKPGNLGVRMGQSDGAQDAEVFMAMYTGPVKTVPQCVGAAERRMQRQPHRKVILVFVDGGHGMELVAGVRRAGEAVLPALSSAYPRATWVSC
jgi:hypothetical protein